MRKQTKKFLTLLTLFLIVLFAISCNKDISKRIKDKIPIFNKVKAENKGIGRYAGEWLASYTIIEERVVDTYDIDENTKAYFIINSDSSITFTYSGEIIKDITQTSDTYYNFMDSEGNEFVLEFENEAKCLVTILGAESGDLYTTVLIKRQ